MKDLSNCRRLVVKVGSALLVDDQGELNREWLASLADDVATLADQDRQVLVVSSGAIALGCAVLGVSKRRARLEEQQAAAAAGQVQLVHAYQQELRRHDIQAAQILLTPEDTENRRRFLNARGTLQKLLDAAVIPVVNENDTVATEEIRYGDNDRLAARVAQLVMADALILLSDVDGLYTSDPRTDGDASLLAEVSEITDEILAMAGPTKSTVGSGGMRTKLQAAQIATHAGCSTIVASGKVQNPLRTLFDGGTHTIFRASRTPAAARMQWMAGMLEVAGALHVDSGALSALRDGSSLLPVGVVAVDGDFRRGDVVSIVDASGREQGRGLAEYSSADAAQLLGCQSADIERLLGYRGRPVMLHRNELVLFDNV